MNSTSQAEEKWISPQKFFKTFTDDPIFFLVIVVALWLGTCLLGFSLFFLRYLQEITGVDDFFSFTLGDPIGTTWRLATGIPWEIIFLDGILYLFMPLFFFILAIRFKKTWIFSVGLVLIAATLSIAIFFDFIANIFEIASYFTLLFVAVLSLVSFSIVLSEEKMPHRYGKGILIVLLFLISVVWSSFQYNHRLYASGKIRGDYRVPICKSLRLTKFILSDGSKIGFQILKTSEYIFASLKTTEGMYLPAQISVGAVVMNSFYDQVDQEAERKKAFIQCGF